MVYLAVVRAPDFRQRSIPLYIDAIRHMHGRQVIGRARRTFPPALLAAGLRASPEASYTHHAAGLGTESAPQAGPTPDPSTSGSFTAYGHSRPAVHGDLWAPGPEGLLFLFHLHGFVPLGAYAAGQRSSEQDQFWARIIESWLEAEARPALPSWHPYPTSLRLIAWCAALGAITEWPEALRHRLAGEIARQARYLRRAIEYDIGGNHVLKNATALVFAGVTVASSGVLDYGVRLLERELARQVLSDGGHEERSTSYHREVSHDLSAVSILLQRAGVDTSDRIARARMTMERWQTLLAGPDGHLPLLNDAWEGPPIERSSISREPVTVLSESGYVVLRHGADQAVLDCGPLCPDHLPAHAHADALSFVLWMDAKPVIIDPGAYTYSGPERGQFRGTAAHATIETDGHDQCEFWGDFRASFLPRVEPPTVRSCGGVVVIESQHDGYRRLRDPVVHHRAFLWMPGSGLVVVDRLKCGRPHETRSSLPLAPKFAPGSGLKIAPLSGGGSIAQEHMAYSPALGTCVQTDKIVERRLTPPGKVFGWSILRREAHVSVSDNLVEVTRHDGGGPVEIRLSRI